MNRSSPQAEAFKKLLPPDLQNTATISFSHRLALSFAAEHLQTIYGKYANPQFCLDTYFSSPEYLGNKQIIHRCSDLPLISFDDIQEMIAAEARYKETADKILKLNEQPDSDEKLYTIANLLGVLPEQNPDGIYTHIIAKDLIPDNEYPAIREVLQSHQNLLDIICRILPRSLIPGFLMEYPAVGCAMTQPHSRFYYRGENAYYRSSKASCFRKTADTDIKEFQDLIDCLRLYQCWETLDQFEVISSWSCSEINYMALAQHYGFKTQMLDITSDLKTALFFACCEIGKDKRWHPLSSNNFAHRNSRKYVSQLCNGNSKYGVLFRTPSDIADLRTCTEPEDSASEVIIPVGYQPFMRCNSQHGYMMLVDKNYDLYQDKYFDKFKFELTDDICQWIYHEMDQGNAIYPRHDIPDLSDEFDALNHQTVFSRDVFINACQDFNCGPDDQDTVEQYLNSLGFFIKDTVAIIEPRKLNQINRVYTLQYVTDHLDTSPKMQPMMSI